MPFDALADLDFDMLRTYEDVLTEMNGTKPKGTADFLAHAQKFGD